MTWIAKTSSPPSPQAEWPQISYFISLNITSDDQLLYLWNRIENIYLAVKLWGLSEIRKKKKKSFQLKIWPAIHKCWFFSQTSPTSYFPLNFSVKQANRKWLTWIVIALSEIGNSARQVCLVYTWPCHSLPSCKRLNLVREVVSPLSLHSKGENLATDEKEYNHMSPGWDEKYPIAVSPEKRSLCN